MPADGRGALVHPHQLQRVLHRAVLPVIDPRLAPYVEHFWSVAWQRHGEAPATSEVITRPVCHLTFENGVADDGGPLVRHGVTMPAAVVTTVWTRRFVVDLDGEGRAFGVGFRPGGLAALAGRELLADLTLPADDVLPGAAALLPRVLAEDDDAARHAVVEGWLVGLAAEPDPAYLDAVALIERVWTDSSIVRVEQIGEVAGLSARSVQRMFRRYVGVGPKWVLVRARLRDAAARLDGEGEASVSLADLAAELGWADQSHLVRDFRRQLGTTPGRYARDARAAPTT
ncbi:transcriptional regulator, AraC family [Beutenbergia cavernae DSM 12333]|uniref:Transcriptional regulator, AraC family n=1 Tax=Beutenbergia cavernae (strain ATCC BAA-8 / DSM 12333 / CCUG 43141 / JCM 11478 / NBRC 16432 / NCIMB 13614 / HKI 0122) TaxID=471853 RepID=C5BV09_BEUC1|nr:transcriptional regulator, AraC family [Beutenbergia cavernae DSM 12333]